MALQRLRPRSQHWEEPAHRPGGLEICRKKSDGKVCNNNARPLAACVRIGVCSRRRAASATRGSAEYNRSAWVGRSGHRVAEPTHLSPLRILSTAREGAELPGRRRPPRREHTDPWALEG